MLPSVTEYHNALSNEGVIKNYENLVFVTDYNRTPILSSSNLAVVFKMEDRNTKKRYAVKCFISEQEYRHESYKHIANNFKVINDPYLVHFEYINDGLHLKEKPIGEREYPVLVMDWIESQTLGEYFSQLYNPDNKTKLYRLACSFDQMALWLLKQPFSHGDLSIDNILVERNGSLRLIDYDGMFTPEMVGQYARENGNPNYRHPKRTPYLFGSFIDDFSILIISISLHVLAYEPSLIRNDLFFRNSIFFTLGDLINSGKTPIWKMMNQVRANEKIAIRLEMLYMAIENTPEARLADLQQILQKID